MDKQIMKRFEQELHAMAAEVGRHLREKDRVDILVERSAETCEQETLAGQRDMAFQSLGRNSALLREVRAALDRIRDDEYGLCQKCDVAISEARLRAVPYARHCLSCQDRIDHQPRSYPFRLAA